VFEDRFCGDGFLVVRRAVAPDVVRACVDAIENELRTRGVGPSDPRTWSEPVVRLPCPEGPAFAAAGTSPPLRRIYDALLGAGRWIEREGVGGTVPVRFPTKRGPGDAGWHIDGSYDVDGRWWVNVHSRGRGLLALFLFTDVTDGDAPTEIIVGSHLDVPRVLAPYGERGVFFGEVVGQLPASTLRRPYARAIGRAGDVYVVDLATCSESLRDDRQLIPSISPGIPERREAPSHDGTTRTTPCRNRWQAKSHWSPVRREEQDVASPCNWARPERRLRHRANDTARAIGDEPPGND
jgi:hypothetical protein